MSKPHLDGTEGLLKEKGVEFVLFQFVDINGVPRAKIVPIAHFREIAVEGAGFAGFAVPGMAQGPHEPDMRAIPDLSSLKFLPWRRNVASFNCDIFVNGKPWPFCTRTILHRLSEEVLKKGYVIHTGIEPEFFLVRKNSSGEIEPFDPMDTAEKPCYDMRGLTRNLDFMAELMSYINELGWDAEAGDHEDANSQFEVDIRYSDCLTASDKFVFYKYMVRNLADKHGVIATFMPKPFPNLTGTGCHIHMSLAERASERNLFLDPDDPELQGLSKLGYHFVAGLMKHARGLTAITCSTINSYKRLWGISVSGATWAPIYITYGGNNRTQMIRIPAPGRVEDRVIDALCNPYLTCAVLLASGLDGIEKALDPGPRNDKNMYELTAEEVRRLGIGTLPRTLKEALDQLKSDEVLRRALGSDFLDYFVDFKTKEWNEYNGTVTSWELEKYLAL